MMELLQWILILRDKSRPAAYAFGRYGNVTLLSFCIACAGCAGIAPGPLEPSPGHLSVEPGTTPSGDIPEIARQVPSVPEPQSQPLHSQEKFTVVVNEVPVKELLFALARDAGVNVDIAPAIQGVVTMNAVEQTLPRLLDRMARQVDLRYVIEDDNVIIMPDEPYFRTYRVDYLNMARDTSNIVQIGTQIADTGSGAEGGGANNSITTIDSVTSNHFWANLVANVSAILGLDGKSGAGSMIGDSVIPHPESGVLTVKATGAQHELIEALIAETVTNANRQVLIQATIVEVSLTDQYQAGINWQVLNEAGAAGFSAVTKTFTSTPVNTASFFSLRYEDPGADGGRAFSAALELLEEFGDVRVLSSPQIMALNNQSAILKVVDNVVYFEVEQETNTTQGVATNTFESTVKTVPVGIVMTITPHINAKDSIVLNVRPTISRINRFVNDPNPTLTVNSPVPEIRVREMESMLRLNDGEIAVMGGLMQNDDRKSDNAIPGLSRIPLLGEVFKTRRREYEKTELVIFLRPLIVRNPSLDGDLSPYKQFSPGYSHLTRTYPRDELPGATSGSPRQDSESVQEETAARNRLLDQPNNPSLHFTLGRLYATQSRWSEAQQAFSDAYRLNSTSPDYALNLAISLDRLGQSETALHYYHVAIDLAQQGVSTLDTAPVVQRINSLLRQIQP